MSNRVNSVEIYEVTTIIVYKKGMNFNMEKEKRVITKWLYWFTFAVAVIAVYKVLDQFSAITNWLKGLIGILYPFIMAIIIAYLFYIPCKSLETKMIKMKIKKKLARGISILIVYLVAIIIIALIVKFIIPTVSESVMDLVNNLPSYYNKAIETIKGMPEDSILKRINAIEIIEGLGDIDLAQYLSLENLEQYIKGVLGLATTLFDIFVTLIVSIYILAERTEILNFAKRFCKAVFRNDTYKGIGKNFRRSNEVFFKFLSSQLLDGFVVGAMVSIAMSILHVKYAILLGFMIGLFNLIPYLGAVVAVVISAIITALTGGISQAIWMLVVVIILQQLDANVINPRITGNSLNISPILVIFSVTVFGAYFGITGMFLAVPIVTVIKLGIEDYISIRDHGKIVENNTATKENVPESIK